jgi:hypothetical protein
MPELSPGFHPPPDMNWSHMDYDRSTVGYIWTEWKAKKKTEIKDKKHTAVESMILLTRPTRI